MLARRQHYLEKTAAATKRLGKESTQRQQYLVARLHAAVLAVDFIMRSLERLGSCRKLVYGQHLRILDSGDAVYYPAGEMPSKDFGWSMSNLVVGRGLSQEGRARRLAGYRPQLSRQRWVHRKNLGAAFAERLEDYLTNWPPIVNKYKHQEESRALFTAFEATELRKLMVDAVCKAQALYTHASLLLDEGEFTDLRAECEQAPRQSASSHNVDSSVVGAQCAHSAAVSRRHYRTQGSEILATRYEAVLPGI